jgi:hypothetical protein
LIIFISSSYLRFFLSLWRLKQILELLFFHFVDKFAIIPISALQDGSIRTFKAADTLLNTISEIALKQPSVRPPEFSKFSSASVWISDILVRHLIALKVALIGAAIRPGELTETLHITCVPLADIFATVRPLKFALPLK